MKALKEALALYWARLDKILLFLCLTASAYGMVIIHSATAYTGSNKYVLVQGIGLFLGLVCALIMAFIDYDRLKKLFWIFMAVSVALLGATLIMGTGGEETGNQSWIRFKLGGFELGVQPSEMVKIAFVFTFACHLSRLKERVNSIVGLLGLGVHAGVIMGLVALQGDLGTALVVVFIVLTMLFAAGLNIFYFLGAFAVVGATAPVLWNFLKPYQQQRIIYGFYPQGDPSGYGYQALLSEMMIGAGGTTGYGYMQGPHVQKGALFAQHTDFIFAAAGEDLGFVGTAAIILLLLLICGKIAYSAIMAKNMMGRLLCAGIFGMLTFQILCNIAMCLAVFPVIGITLPFFSYGGSSIVSVFLGVGVVLSVNARRDEYFYEYTVGEEEFR